MKLFLVQIGAFTLSYETLYSVILHTYEQIMIVLIYIVNIDINTTNTTLLITGVITFIIIYIGLWTSNCGYFMRFYLLILFLYFANKEGSTVTIKCIILYTFI